MIDPRHIELSIAHASLVKSAENEARREIQAAIALGDIEGILPPWGNAADSWYEASFGVTERELVEMADAAAARYYALRRISIGRRTRRKRREALHAYIRVSARLTAAHGLTTTWG